MPDTPAAPALPLDRPALESAALRALDLARGLGASDAEAECSASVGQSVTVRLGEVETVEYNRDKALAVTVYFGQRRGNASTSDLSADSIRRTVEAACAIARHTAPDEAAGLPDAARLYRGEAPGLDLFHPWCLTVEEAIAAARETEAAARAVDARITNSEGATVSSWDADFV
ncbi:MAG TPA: DNA gyrase modulator, partial [Usitatibacteraceae bacterium]|nr:DNA gyrase modulator [Usitatibacteraceae bacterium]